MIIEDKQVKLRILKAENGKNIVSKEKLVDENGKIEYAVKSEAVYLGKNDSKDNYIEIDAELI